ncbi:hypothetical protein WN944_023868 [Citrus x changshan-huyou]|uniref:Uncharacterized protein n=1 Tax=Citrus x changshan-huyou TaxID=2935761 RepID=A0AAP0LPH8_9ROSI
MLGKAVKEKSGSVSREVFECLKRQQKNLIKMDGLVSEVTLSLLAEEPIFTGTEVTTTSSWRRRKTRHSGEPPGGVVRSGFSTPRQNKTAPKQTKRCVPHSRGTASDILEEGGDDVKSAWPLWAGPHTCYNGNYNGKQGYKPGTTVRRENTRSHSDLDLWNRLAPYVLRLFGRHGPSPISIRHRVPARQLTKLIDERILLAYLMISSVLPPIESENSAFCVSNGVRRRKINRKVRHIELRNRQDSLYTGRAETSSESPFPLEVRSLNACSCCPFGHWIIAILTSPSAKITSSCFSLSPVVCAYEKPSF